MKSIIIYRIIIIIAFSILCSGVYAQMIDNKINIYIGASGGSFMGDDLVSEENFSAPSFFNNYRTNRGFYLKGTIPVGQMLSFGVAFGNIYAQEWESETSRDFLEANCEQISISPVFQFHTKSTPTGVFNRLKLSIELNPVFGISNTTLKKSLYKITKNSKPISEMYESDDAYFGLEGNVGVEYELNQRFGLFINYAISVSQINSLLYTDQEFVSSSLRAGILVKFALDKRYLYH